jgi:hypothetical protein
MTTKMLQQKSKKLCKNRANSTQLELTSVRGIVEQ